MRVFEILNMVPKYSGTFRPTVLVVHADVDRADRFADCLPAEYTVQTANSGDVALEMLTADVNVVVIKRGVGDTTAESVLDSARDRGFDGRAILLTDERPALERIIQQFDDYVITPAARTDVRDAVERMLKRDAYDSRMQEILSLVSRMATLEANLSIDELLTSDTYARLDARLDEFRKHGVDLGSLDQDEYAEFSSEKLGVVLS